jgi:hypothetical protein
MQKTLIRSLQIGFFLAFILYALGMVFSNGVCCADDAFFANVARNYSSGQGYKSTLINYPLIYFDPRISIGPTIVFPAAAVIWIVGNLYWAPGLAAVLIWACLLLLIGHYCRRWIHGDMQFLIYEVAFLSLCILNFSYHFVQWYALLGEIPAGLLILLAVLIYFDRKKPINYFLSGLVFSLALNTKLIVVVSFGGFMLSLLLMNTSVIFNNNPMPMSLILKIMWERFFHRQNGMKGPARVSERIYIKLDWQPLFLLLIGCVIPLLLFEVWKIAVLGLDGYIQNQMDMLVQLRSLGVTSEKTAMSGILVERLNTIFTRFGLYLPVIFIILLFNLWATKHFDRDQYPLYMSLVMICVVHTVYWLFFSIGWARYYVIIILIFNFLLALPTIWPGKNIPYRVLYTILIISITVPNWSKVSYPLKSSDGHLFRPSQKLETLLTVSSFIDDTIGDQCLVSQEWPTFDDVYFLMDKQPSIVKFADPEFYTLLKPYLIVLNKGFSDLESQALIDALADCSKVSTFEPYIVGECR